MVCVVFLTWRVSDTEPRLLHKEVELSELQVTQMPSVPAEAVLTLELGGRVLAESRAHCQQGHARFQERMALQIQGGGSEGQSCMLRVSAKGTRSSPPNCPEEFSAEVAFTTKDIMRRVHSKHGQQYFHYRMLPKDSSASASLRPSLSMRLREVTGR
ncbi:unnamed protein product [Effrenium voratum]|nr:unnamed protein product [Effrenium voratum]